MQWHPNFLEILARSQLARKQDRDIVACDLDKVACVYVQMRALLFVATLTSGITTAMGRVENAVATALDLTGASHNKSGRDTSHLPPAALLLDDCTEDSCHCSYQVLSHCIQARDGMH